MDPLITQTPQALLDQNVACAMNIGMRMLQSGAEVSRVEDAIARICTALGAKEAHVFTVTAGIIVTCFDAQGNCATQLRRTKSSKYDLYRIEQLNQLSRDICRTPLPKAEIDRRLQQIDCLQSYPLWLILLAYVGISAFLSAFFQGSVRDAVAAGITGAVLCLLERLLLKAKLENILTTFILSFLAGLCNVLLVKIGLGQNYGAICIGNIMLLIPGIAMTNAVHDMFVGDMISGTSRFFQSLVIACMVAFGFTAAGILL